MAVPGRAPLDGSASNIERWARGRPCAAFFIIDRRQRRAVSLGTG
jgi:hypothetical protein